MYYRFTATLEIWNISQKNTSFFKHYLYVKGILTILRRVIDNCFVLYIIFLDLKNRFKLRLPRLKYLRDVTNIHGDWQL